ncbi:hypothetical protein Tco_1100981 [Tanacetum coccineum]
MFVQGYNDDDDFVPNMPTLISKLDVSDPLDFHPNDSAALTVVSVKLKGTGTYQVSRSRFDTAYPRIRYGILGFLGVGTMLDIFQNIHILYLEFDILSISGYGVLSFIPLWSLVSAGKDIPYLP